MTHTLSSTYFPMARTQLGATLLIAIVFLLIITILGISSMRGVSLESRITANLKQQKTLMSAAEAGLRIAETDIPIDIAKPCTTTVCMPWTLSDFTPDFTSDTNMDTLPRFTAAYATNVATVPTGYDMKIQWYVVLLGPMDVPSVGSSALTPGKGVKYYEVNSCASTVLCTSDTITRRVILRSVIARSY